MQRSPESPDNENNSQWEDVSDSGLYSDSCIYFEGITPRSNPVDPCPYWEYTWFDVPLTRDNALTLSPSFIQLPKQVKTIRLGITSFDLKVSEDVNIYCYLNHRERQMGCWAIQTVTCIYESGKMVELKNLEEYDGGDEMLVAAIKHRRRNKGAITLTFRFFMEKSVGSYVYHLCDMRLGAQLWEAAVKETQMTDVVFIVGDRSFAAHKFLLTARSPVFSAMFGTDMVESRTGRIKVDDVVPETFQQFLRFLYTGQLEEPASEELAYVADKYDVKTLTAICESAFSFFSNMDADNSFPSVGSSAMAADASDPALLPFHVQRKVDSFWISEHVSVTTGDPSRAVCEEQGQSLVVPVFFDDSDYFSFRREPHYFCGIIVMSDEIRLVGGRAGQDAFRIVDIFSTFKRYIMTDDAFLYFIRMKPMGYPAGSEGAEPARTFTVKPHPEDRSPSFRNFDVPVEFLVCHSPSISEFSYAFRDELFSRNLWSSSVDKNWTDIDFVVGDKTFCAHRALLAARCPALIPPGTIDSSDPARIENLKASTFEDLLCFLYTGMLKKFPSVALYKAALSYEVDLLKRLFEMRHPEKVADISPDCPME